MLRHRKRQRDTTFIEVITPGARELAKRRSSVRSYFNTGKRRFLAPAAAVVGAAGIARTIANRVFRTVGTQTNPKPKTQEKNTQNPKNFVEKRYSNGMYSGRFKKGKRKPNVYNGVVMKRETGYNVADDDGTLTPGAYTSPIGCVWTGVTALVSDEFQRTVLLAILRKMCAAKGFEFNSGDDKINDTTQTAVGGSMGSFHYTFRQGGDNTSEERSIAMASTLKWIDLTNLWLADMKSLFSAYSDIKFDKIWIYSKANDAGNVTNIVPVMALNMIDLKIKYTATHSLFIQNRTKDTDGGDNTDAVDTNPLMGRIYIANGSYVRTNLQGQNAGVDWGRPNQGSGRFVIEPQKWTVNGDSQQLFSRLVPKSAFEDCYKSVNVKLQPGEIKKASVTHKKFVKFDTLFWKAFLPEMVLTERFPIQFGKSMVFGFQKIVRTATIDSATAYDSRIQIACTNRQYLAVEAFPVRKQAFIARNLQPEVS